PQVVAVSHELWGVEALLRWHDPERGPMPTVDLIRLAEDSGLISAVTDFVLGEAMSQVMTWERSSLARGLSLSVNASAVRLRNRNWGARLKRAWAQSGLPPSALDVEIAESPVMLSTAAPAAALSAIPALGVRLSIDDFGTGYSSLSRLRHLPVHSVKIDRMFV